MIPRLDGTREIVAFQECSSILLYKNTEYEEYPKHWHTSTEIIMPEQNEYQVACNGKIYELNVGDILIVPPGVVHTMPAKEGVRYIILVNLSNSSMSQSLDSLFAFIQPAIVISPQSHLPIYQMCRNLIAESIDEYFGNEPFKEIAAYSSLLKLILLTGRCRTSQNDLYQSVPSRQQEYVQNFMALCEYINANCTEEFSLSEAAWTAGFSKFHFSKLFKNFTGTTFYSYVNERRISHASMLLLNSEKSVTDIAISSGFNSISSFNRIFKIIKGCTPSEFRKLYLSENAPHGNRSDPPASE